MQLFKNIKKTTALNKKQAMSEKDGKKLDSKTCSSSVITLSTSGQNETKTSSDKKVNTSTTLPVETKKLSIEERKKIDEKNIKDYIMGKKTMQF